MRCLTSFFALLFAACASDSALAQSAQNYCAVNRDAPECFCQGEHAQDLKCLRFRGANPGFSSKGVGTSATFNPDVSATVKAATAPEALPLAVNRSDHKLYVHFGASDDLKGLPDATSLVKQLKSGGYVVGGADNQRDDAGYSAVDYFRADDLQVAQDIADVVNTWLKANQKSEIATLKPRLQNVRSTPGHIGVWIFGHPPKT